jgi:hypothetical protein
MTKYNIFLENFIAREISMVENKEMELLNFIFSQLSEENKKLIIENAEKLVEKQRREPPGRDNFSNSHFKNFERK